MQLLLRSYKFFTLVLFVSLHAESFVHPKKHVKTHLIQSDIKWKKKSHSLMFFSIRTGGWHTSYSSM